MKRIATFGTFDLFHIGHVNILRRARELGDWLSVGVSTDELNIAKKGIPPVHTFEERAVIIAAVRYVDEVFAEHSLEQKRTYLLNVRADVLVMGNDWAGRFDEFADIVEVVYLPRTPEISTTHIKRFIHGLEMS